jgi:hypothetical protein
MSALTRTRRRSGLNRETRQVVLDFVRRNTTFRGLDLDRLHDGEQRELAQLVHAATVPSGGTNFSQLDKKQRHAYERLTEKLAGQPGAFKAERNANDLRTRASALARRAAKPIRPKPEREVAFLEQIGDHLARNILHAEHAAALAVIVPQLLSGQTYAPGARIEMGEGDAATLVVDKRFGLIGLDRDPKGMLSGGWQDAVRHLSRNGYLRLEESGPEFKIQLGSRTRRALWGTS